MSWVGTRAVDVYLGRNEAAVSLREAAPIWSRHDSVESALDEAFGVIAMERSTWIRPRVRLWLSAALARPFVCQPVTGLRRWTEVLAMARATAPDSTGLEGPCDVAIEDWPGVVPALAAATASALLTKVITAARRHRVVLRSLRPWWSAALDQARARNSTAELIALHDTDGMTVFTAARGIINSAEVYLPSPIHDQSSRMLARMAVSAGLSPGEATQWQLGRSRSVGSVGMPFAGEVVRP